MCIGAQFAITEGTLALARMIASFRVELVDDRPVIPVGIVTALVGIPLFMLIVARTRGEQS